MTAWYLLLSTVALFFVAAIWSSERWLNSAIKCAFIALAAFGAVVTAGAWHIA